MTMKPDDIRRGEIITADWLNRSKNAGIHDVRIGAGLVGTVTKGMVAIASAGRPNGSPAIAPSPWLVKSQQDDYLTCVSFPAISEPEEVSVAKPPELRGGTNSNPPYIDEETVVWALPMYDSSVLGADGNPPVLMDINIDARSNVSFWAKMTGSAADGDGWKYAWAEQEETAAGYQNKTGGRSGTTSAGFARNAAEAAGTLGAPIPNGVVTRCWVGVDENGDPTYRVDLSTAGVLGLVLIQTGGSAGDATTQCSFTYTAQDMHGNELATAVNPTSLPHQETRPAVGVRIAATAGVGTFETGELVILTTNEKDQLKKCNESA